MLYARWKTATAANQATINLHKNDGSNETSSFVKSSKQQTFKVNLDANPFTITGWTFGNWSTAEKGVGDTAKSYANGAEVTLNNGDTLDLYAQWYKQDGDSITIPGKDMIPGNEDDATANGDGKGNNPTRDSATGVITIPAGGSVTVGGTITELPNGGKLNPDGSIEINPGSGDKDPIIVPPIDPADPNPITPPQGTYLVTYNPGVATNNKLIFQYVNVGTDHTVAANTFTYDGHVFAYWTNEDGDRVKVGTTVSTTTVLTANWLIQKEDGTIVVPDPGNPPDGTIEIKPDPDNPGNKPGVDEDGNVKVPEGGEVVKKPSGGSVELPDGG